MLLESGARKPPHPIRGIDTHELVWTADNIPEVTISIYIPMIAPVRRPFQKWRQTDRLVWSGLLLQ
jgi:hypothetical protein